LTSDILKIEAIIRPNRLEAVQESLQDLDVHSITVIEVRGINRARALGHTFRGSQYANNLAPRTKIEIFVLEEQAAAVIEAIQEAAFTGESGDGKVFVTHVADALRIRTGEKGKTALS
jgi:nitrogen regulatory protein P-II 1